MLNFTAIDFETANSFRGSPCSVGLVRVRDGRTVEERHWLIKPPKGADHFDPWNVSIHGITSDMVQDAPRWNEVLPRIVDFVGGDILVSHNAAFDTGVIRYACAADTIECPEFNFLCTLVTARRALQLPSYRLPYVVEALGLSMKNHHDALADARAVVNIIDRLSEQHAAADLQELADTVGVRLGYMAPGIYRGGQARAKSTSKPLTDVEINTEADPDGYLYGRVVVFTGGLKSMPREVARQECARLGAIPEANTTKRTNVLVIGDIDPTVLRPGSELTGKARKAFELQDKGQSIEVMTEDDFLRCLDGTQLDGVEVLLPNSSTGS